jgi:hypothetical protein
LKWRRRFLVVEQRGAPALVGGCLSSAAATDDAVAISQSRKGISLEYKNASIIMAAMAFF